MDTLINVASNYLTPSLGGIALACVVIGILIGLVRKAVDKLGTTPVMLTIGGIVIAALAVRYVSRPAQVQAQPQPVAVKQTSHKPILHKARPRHRRRYVQYPGF
jgi:hypothetical protein